MNTKNKDDIKQLGKPRIDFLGDKVELLDDGSILCQQTGGWLEPGTWERLKNEVELDVDAYQRKIKAAKLDIERWEKIVNEASEGKNNDR